MAGERSRASFLLQLGLRAIAAGNIGWLCRAVPQAQVSELHRLDQPPRTHRPRLPSSWQI